ncbi:MAG: dockerin type I repeat-containing protein [Ruminococcus sp.]|nr:dockerin type I repeat-containing protein [Ruminococcus sp.]
MKRILSAFLAVLLACSMVLNVSAESVGITYECENGYTATKLSNPTLGSGEIDGLIGDRSQSYSWSSVGYGDYIYIGTCFATIYHALSIIGGQTGMDTAKIQDLLHALYNGTLYAGDHGVAHTPSRSYIVKVNTKTMETTIVKGPTQVAGYRAATLFNGKIYFAVSTVTPYILEVDPETDETKIIYYSETPSDPSIATGIRGIAVYRDMLVATMIGDNGAYVVASKNPSDGQDAFEVICTQQDLLDYPAYHFLDSVFGGSIYDIIEYNDKLYMSVVTGKNGDKQPFALFSGQPDENGKWNFELVIGNEDDGAKYPFGLGCPRSGAANIYVHDGYLYIGGYNDPMIALPSILKLNFESVYKDLSSPVCLWRLDKNDDIELVAGEANELFPEGPIGNMGPGFGSNTNQYVWRMESYNGKFYLGTFDMSSVLYPIMQFTNGDILKMSKEEWASQINYIKILIDSLGLGATEDEATPANVFSASFDEDEFIKELYMLIEFMQQIDYDASALDSEEYIAQLTALMTKISAEYEKIKDQLSAEITSKLDNLLSNEKIVNLGYFVKTCDYLRTAERGFDFFVSEDGVNFEAITLDGFGDPYNYGARVFSITDSGLCIGTANPFYGTQLWLLNEPENESLNYDLNEDGFVNVNDVTYAQRVLAEEIAMPEYDNFGDLDGNGKFTVNDITFLQRYLVEDF